MDNRKLIGVVILGFALWLGSLGAMVGALGGWHEATSPAFIGAAFTSFSGVAVMVLGALGISLPGASK